MIKSRNTFDDQSGRTCLLNQTEDADLNALNMITGAKLTKH